MTTVRPTTPDDPDATLTAALAPLSPEDRQSVDSQQYCPVLTQNRLGSMGTPVKLTVGGESVFLCCEGCSDKALADPPGILAKVKELQAKDLPPAQGKKAIENSSDLKKEQSIKEALAELDPADRTVAETQRFCAVLESKRLGSMGPPVKLMIDGQSVFLCCEGCQTRALKAPQETAAKAKSLAGSSHD